MRGCWWPWFIVLSGSLVLAESPEPKVERLIESLRSDDLAERQKALDALASRRDSSEKLAPALRASLLDADPARRRHAAVALAALGVGEPAVIDELLAAMGRRSRGAYLPHPELARGAMGALVQLGPPVTPALIKALHDDRYAGRDLALEALGEIGPAAKDALPTLKKLLATDDVAILCRTIETKWRIDGDAAFALERLIPLLGQQRRHQGFFVTLTLARLGRDAKPAVPALIAALQRNHDHNALWALEELAPHAKELVLPALRDALRRPETANGAAIALQNLGEPTESLVPVQLQRLKACQPNDGQDPMRIMYTVVVHGPAAKPYVGEVIALLKHDNPAVRNAAAWGAPRMFADDRIVTAALRAAQQDPATAEEATRSLKMLEEARR